MTPLADAEDDDRRSALPSRRQAGARRRVCPFRRSHPAPRPCLDLPTQRDRRAFVEEGGFLYDSDAYNDELPYWTYDYGRPHLIIPHTLDDNARPRGGARRNCRAARRRNPRPDPSPGHARGACRILGRAPDRHRAFGSFPPGWNSNEQVGPCREGRRRSGSHLTPCWRKTDSNLWSHFQRGQRFRARHSVFPVDGTGCERSNLRKRRFRVPGSQGNLARQGTCVVLNGWCIEACVGGSKFGIKVLQKHNRYF